MASRKSIAKVQLGSLTPDKAAMASGQGTSAIDQAGVHLPQINANHPSENGEVRSMDNLIAKAAVRTSRQSVINKKVSSESAKGPSSNPPSVAERTARPSIINSHSRNDGRSDQSTSETAAVKRESRPSVIGKHSGGKVSNEGNRVALTPRDISFEESTSSDSSHKVVAVAVNEVRREAEPVAKLSSKLVDAGRSDLSPSAPSQPMASHRTQRNTIIKQSPVKITATKASDANGKLRSNYSFLHLINLMWCVCSNTASLYQSNRTENMCRSALRRHEDCFRNPSPRQAD